MTPSHRYLLLQLSRWVAPSGSLVRTRLFAVLIVTYATFVATYLAVNFYSIGRDARALYLPGEARLPFVPEFEFLYMMGYVFPLLAILRLPGTREFRRLVLAFILTLSVAYATYLIYPVYLERPPIEVDSLATFLLSLEYKDPSYNHFPSLHIAISWLIYLSCSGGVRHHGVLVALLIGISLSTLFVKQHYLVDVIYGIGLAAATWWAGGKLDERASRVSLVGKGRRRQ